MNTFKLSLLGCLLGATSPLLQAATAGQSMVNPQSGVVVEPLGREAEGIGLSEWACGYYDLSKRAVFVVREQGAVGVNQLADVSIGVEGGMVCFAVLNDCQ